MISQTKKKGNPLDAGREIPGVGGGLQRTLSRVEETPEWETKGKTRPEAHLTYARPDRQSTAVGSRAFFFRIMCEIVCLSDDHSKAAFISRRGRSISIARRDCATAAAPYPSRRNDLRDVDVAGGACVSYTCLEPTGLLSFIGEQEAASSSGFIFRISQH